MSGTPVSLNRCAWCGQDPLYTAYHDDEWGVPVFDERRLFEMLILEGAQAGLAWITILRKREGYRRAFDGFDPEKIAGYDEARIQALLADPGIVRNRLKVQAAVVNARVLLDLRGRGESFADLLWSPVDGVPRLNAWRRQEDVPATTPESDAMSRNLKGLGFKFVGSTVCYAFMQAAGMVNDHTTDCFRHAEVGGATVR
jgi:DNA-3-methyladenine glycosylase I